VRRSRRHGASCGGSGSAFPCLPGGTGLCRSRLCDPPQHLQPAALLRPPRRPAVAGQRSVGVRQTDDIPRPPGLRRALGPYSRRAEAVCPPGPDPAPYGNRSHPLTMSRVSRHRERTLLRLPGAIEARSTASTLKSRRAQGWGLVYTCFDQKVHRETDGHMRGRTGTADAREGARIDSASYPDSSRGRSGSSSGSPTAHWNLALGDAAGHLRQPSPHLHPRRGTLDL
jgi:hypothetical protein